METVSSTLGGSTRTCWNRRSRALSFSMYLQPETSMLSPATRAHSIATCSAERGQSVPKCAASRQLFACIFRMHMTATRTAQGH